MTVPLLLAQRWIYKHDGIQLFNIISNVILQYKAPKVIFNKNIVFNNITNILLLLLVY